MYCTIGESEITKMTQRKVRIKRRREERKGKNEEQKEKEVMNGDR